MAGLCNKDDLVVDPIPDRPRFRDLVQGGARSRIGVFADRGAGNYRSDLKRSGIASIIDTGARPERQEDPA
jgi:hypothetical protein